MTNLWSDEIMDYVERTDEQLLEDERERIDRLYGKDSENACSSMDWRLSGWSRYVEDRGNGCLVYNATPDQTAPNVITSYQADLDREAKRERELEFFWKDERPYFHDPAPLGFDPLNLIQDETEEGVTISDVWKDPLARTLWLAMKARHLTSQYFRKACIQQAAGLRKNPPKTVNELYISTGDYALGGGTSYYFRVQLYPYIVRILIDEGRWPWFLPPVSLVSDHVLGWTVNKKEKAA